MSFDIESRRKRHAVMSSQLVYLNNAELAKLIRPIPRPQYGWGSSGITKLGATQIFVKRIPMTTLELENAYSTKNHYRLPTYYSYGIGSAGLGVWREIAAGDHDAWFEDVVLLIAPIYNADGNERIQLTNRPGQNGPYGGMGQRPNAQQLDLNRDHMKLESPEARSVVRMMISIVDDDGNGQISREEWRRLVLRNCSSSHHHHSKGS